ncbi:MAG: hypothetical protein MJK07_23210 [Flavobacteriales bacterium]|nr:hypothetical protein [Flavobacteriales bacterium]
MKKIYITTLYILANLTLFGQVDTTQIKFEEKKFSLPMTKEVARKTFDLDKYHQNGHINNCNFLAHLKNDSTVIGITFYKRIYKENLEKSLEVSEYSREKYIADLEKKYDSTFKLLDIENVAFINPQFVYLELEDGSVIVVGSLYYNLMYNTYTTISFFHDITIKELRSYLRNYY